MHQVICLESFGKHTDHHTIKKCRDPACWSSYQKLNSKPSVLDTWSALVDDGLHPVMLHMFTSGIDYGIGSLFDD